MAAENNDFCEDSKNTTHSTTIVVFRRKQYGPFTEARIFGDRIQKRRSLDISRLLVMVQEIGIGGRRPPVTTYFDSFLFNVSDDIAWLLLHLNADSLLDVNHQPVTHQKIPGWSGFHSLKFIETSPPTAIGYCPMIQANANDYSTINTVMKLSSDIANTLGQPNSAVTFDLTIYTKRKQLQLRYP